MRAGLVLTTPGPAAETLTGVIPCSAATAAGRQRLAWDGKDRQGKLAPLGLYLCKISMGVTMMMSERPNRPRGIRRFSARKGCRGERRSVRLVLSNAVWDQDIADASDGLDVKR